MSKAFDRTGVITIAIFLVVMAFVVRECNSQREAGARRDGQWEQSEYDHCVRENLREWQRHYGKPYSEITDRELATIARVCN